LPVASVIIGVEQIERLSFDSSLENSILKPPWGCVNSISLKEFAAMQKIDFAKGDGLVPVIVQDHGTREVLMVAYMNKQAWDKTVKTGKAHYYSRSRRGLWFKGEESGHFQVVKNIFIDCDNDTLLLQVRQIGGAACHEGYQSCFFRKKAKRDWKVIAKKVFDPREVYKK